MKDAPALLQPDVSKGDRAADGIGGVAGPIEALHAVGPCPVRALEVPDRPGRQRKESGIRCTAEVVASGRKLERPPGVHHGSGQVASRLRHRRAVHLDQPGEASKHVVVLHDHLGRFGLRLQPVLGLAEPAFNAVLLAACEHDPGKPDAEYGPAREDVVGERSEPTTERRLLPDLAHGGNRELDQARRPVEVVGSERMPDRLRRVVVLLVPCPESAKSWWYR